MNTSDLPIIDNTYRFECRQCGSCCTGNMKIHLNLYDLYKMSRFIKFAGADELFDQKFVYLAPGENKTWIPQIRFKNKPFKFCPFLINEMDEQDRLKGFCSMHPDSKPLICAQAPVGRIIDFKTNSNRWVFIKPAPDCQGIYSLKSNYLKDHKIKYQQELDYQYRFFRILESIKNNNLSKREYLCLLYYFPVDHSFETILEEKERQFIKTDN